MEELFNEVLPNMPIYVASIILMYVLWPLVKLFGSKEISNDVKELIDNIKTCTIGKNNFYQLKDGVRLDNELEKPPTFRYLKVNDLDIYPLLTRKEVKAIRQAIYNRKIAEIGRLLKA